MPVARRTPAKTRQRLLDTAARHFNSLGYHAAGTNQIAAEAGYSPQTFYRHFADKRAIFLAVYGMWSRALSERLTAASAGKRTQNTRTRAMVHAMISHHREWAIFRASLLELFSTDEVVRRARIEERRAHLAMLQHSLGSSLESALLVMWLCERAADGAASGEAEAYLTSAPKLEEALSALIQLAHSPG